MRILFTILVFSNLIGFGQNYIQTQQENDIALFDLQNHDIISEKSFDFFVHYDINPGEFKYFITLEDVPVRSKPELNSAYYDLYIPSGTNIKVYRFIPGKDFHAVKYRDTWGFIPGTTIKPKPEMPKKLHISEVDTPPVLLSSAGLSYPGFAKARKIEGTVLLRIYINKLGDVTEAEIIEGIPELNLEALGYAKSLRFKPALSKGNPVEVFANFPVEFSLPD